VNIRTAIIFAAGDGTRFRPYSQKTPKTLFQINGEALLARHIRQLNTVFDLEEIIVLTGSAHSLITNSVDGLATKTPLRCHKVPPQLIRHGLIGGYAFLATLPLKGPFLALLGDEYYEITDLKRLAAFLPMYKGTLVVGVKRVDEFHNYFGNFSIDYDEETGGIATLIEKPRVISSSFFGAGLLISNQNLCKSAEENLVTGKNMIQVINEFFLPTAVNPQGFLLDGTYANINQREDVFRLKKKLRSNGKISIDAVIPALNEEASIGYVVEDLKRFVNDVHVLDNESTDNTAAIARKAGAIVHTACYAGYGHAIREGLTKAKGDLIIITEADGSFTASDLAKMLAYIYDVDAVIGTRTHREFIESDAGFSSLQILVNILYGRALSVLWWNRKARFSDVGCSFRLVWKDTIKDIYANLSSDGPEFAPELVIELLNHWCRVVEVPITYRRRLGGRSKFSRNLLSLSYTALRMSTLICKRRVASWCSNLSTISQSLLRR